MLDSGNTFDLAQLITDNAIAGMIRHFIHGVPVTDETLAVEEIHTVGPFSNFLSTDHTYRHMRELSTPKLLDRRVRDQWQADGGLDMGARATAEAKRILAEHTPEPLPDDVAARLSEIVQATEAAAPTRHRS